jgi:hypothetical protein
MCNSLSELYNTAKTRRFDILGGITTQLNTGSNFQAAIARLAHASHATTTRDTTDLCTCSEGNVYSRRIRVPGEDGVDGQPGATPIARLFPGTNGRPGNCAIIVRSKTGQEQTYRSRYQLELVGFDVEDENEDDIFEPGEHLFIRRIRVRNSGGMPSPTSKTLLEISPSDCLSLVTNNEGRAFIPNIPAGQTVTLQGSKSQDYRT